MYFTGKMGRDKLMKRQTEREGGGERELYVTFPKEL